MCADALDLAVQMDRLRRLEDGWLDGEGLAPRADGLDWLAGVLRRRLAEDQPPLHFYPTEEGGVQAEWDIGTREISMTVDLRRRSAQWQALDTGTGDVISERELDLEDGRAWRWIHECFRADRPPRASGSRTAGP